MPRSLSLALARARAAYCREARFRLASATLRALISAALNLSSPSFSPSRLAASRNEAVRVALYASALTTFSGSSEPGRAASRRRSRRMACSAASAWRWRAFSIAFFCMSMRALKVSLILGLGSTYASLGGGGRASGVGMLRTALMGFWRSSQAWRAVKVLVVVQ